MRVKLIYKIGDLEFLESPPKKVESKPIQSKQLFEKNLIPFMASAPQYTRPPGLWNIEG